MNLASVPHYVQRFKVGWNLFDDFGDIVRRQRIMFPLAVDDCVRLKNALVNLGNSKDWDALVKRANAGSSMA